MIICSKVYKNYGNKVILRSLSFKLMDNSITAIVGMSGCGKTTLLNIISGLLKPDSGSIYLDENDITGVVGHVSYMMQKDLLLEHLNIIDNVSLPLIIKGEKKEVANCAVEKYFNKFEIEGIQKMFPNELSMGMRQRAAFLRTYINSNGVILLDEPFGALDMITRNIIQKWLLTVVKKSSITALIITHDIEEAIYLSDKIFVLNEESKNLIEVKKPFDKSTILKIMDRM